MNPPGLTHPWAAEPLVMALAAVAAVCFVQGFLRLRRRGRSDHAPWTRAALFAAGLALLVLPLISPLDELADRYLLSAHMLEHVLIADAAIALTIVAVRGPLLYFAVPQPLLRTLGHKAWLRTAAAWLFRPKVALIAWAAAFGLWHIPSVYDYAARHPVVHDLEHLSFIVAGLLVWTVLIDPSGHGGVSRARRLAMIVVLFVFGTAIADVLIFSPTTLYPFYADQPHRVFGLSPLRDQQLAGLVMLVEQALTLGTCAALLLWPELKARRRARLKVVSEQPAT